MTESLRRRILVTGANGQVGWELRRSLQPLGEVIATEFDPQVGAQRTLNLADPDAIRTLVRELRPQLIVNAAAYTAVDQAEDDVEMAMAINAVAPGVLAEEAKRCGAALVHYSTEYVFDGTKNSPYAEADQPNPINVYGYSKLAGEQAIQQVDGAHLIFRTSWLYGARGKNFLLTILRLARERPELNIVNDQFGAPNWSYMLGEATAQALATQIGNAATPGREWAAVLARLQAVSGLYHLSSSGVASWCEFARNIVELAIARGASPCEVKGITSDQFPAHARRPLNSRLVTDKFSSVFGLSLPSWDESLKLCMEGMSF